MEEQLKDLHSEGAGQGLFMYLCPILEEDIATALMDPLLSSNQCPKCKRDFPFANKVKLRAGASIVHFVYYGHIQNQTLNVVLVVEKYLGTSGHKAWALCYYNIRQ